MNGRYVDIHILCRTVIWSY